MSISKKSIIPTMLVAVLMLNSCGKAAPEEYYNKVKVEMPIEAKYTAMGSYGVQFTEASISKPSNKILIWYPSELVESNNTYPLVIMANGTGVKASRYTEVFRHLASWGFVVVGNEDGSSWSGQSTSDLLDYMVKQNDDANSIFYKRVETQNVGVGGHSQGGVGAINAVTNYANSNRYKAIYTASATSHELANNLKWDYDVSKVQIPYMMVAGTEKVDAETITPLSSLQENSDLMDSTVPRLIMRLVAEDHGNMLYKADGYMTAWFCYYLQNDTEAKAAFVGNNAEVERNKRWQDVKRYNLNY